MKRNFMTTLVLSTLLAPIPSLGNPAEKIEATRLCSEVVKQGSPRLQPDEIRSICEASSQPAQVWECARKRMNNGARFGPAVDYCKTASK